MNKTPRLFLPLIMTCIFAAEGLAGEVVTFFPTGSVKSIKQVTVNFSTDMVAMGDPRSKDDPFSITCNTKTKKNSADGDGEGYEGEGAPRQNSIATKSNVKTPKYSTRWADNQNWVLDFNDPLQAGLRCAFKIKPNLVDLAMNKVTGLDEYSFTTAGPALLEVAPTYGRIEPEQYFVAEIDGELDQKSVAQKAYFEVDGMPDRVGVKIISGKDREVVIKAAVDDSWRWNKYKKFLDQKPTMAFTKIKVFENFIVLAATRRFPENVRVTFHWPEGILSRTGMPVEEAQKFEFTVMEPFTVSFNCERAAPERPCNPIAAMQLNFSTRISLASLKGTTLVSSSGKTWTPIELSQGDQNKNVSGTMQLTPSTSVGVSIISNFSDEKVNGLTFAGPFPEETKFKINLPKKLKDELGRSLSNEKSFPLAVATDQYIPLLKFPGSFGILELKSEPILPVSMRNLEKNIKSAQVTIEAKSLTLSSNDKLKEIIRWYQKVIDKNSREYELKKQPLLVGPKAKKFHVKKPLGERAFELVGIPLQKPGFHVIEMESPRLGELLTGEAGSMFVATGVLVTDMAVHFKHGRESSLVWVTQLSTGKPASGAKIVVMRAGGEQESEGITDANGILRLPRNYDCSQQPDPVYNGCETFVFAQKDDDISFVSDRWQKGIEPWRFNLTSNYVHSSWGPVALHTIFDRTAAQPGESIQMKHVIREFRNSKFHQLDKTKRPKRVLVVHSASRKVYTLPFVLDEATGTALSKFSIPMGATLGEYEVYLSNKDQLPAKETEENDPWDYSAMSTGGFIVSEYRLPLMKAAVKVSGEPLVRPSEVSVDLSASYLSGGPAKNLKVKLRTSMEPGYFRPDVPGGADYTFFSSAMETGVFDYDIRQSKEEQFLKVSELTLGKDGGLSTKVSGIPPVKAIKNLMMEMEYTDPNGEIKTASADTTLFPADYAVGLRSDSWVAEPGKVKSLGVITDNLGKPQKNRSYIVEAFKTNYITHRKRLVGGFYSYDAKSEVVSLGKVCEGKSDDLGRFQCDPSGLPAGSITLQAKVTDDKGRSTYASIGVSVFESGSDSWWVPSDSDRIDLIPEKNKYEPGETAKLVLKSPFPVSTVLVTVERAGVMESFVTEVTRDKPTITVPLKDDYTPNVFISALAIRGRVGDPKATSLVDLARPSMRMGIAEIRVGWKAHELLVAVKSDKTKYRAREKIQASIQVKTATGAKLPAGAEVVVAAVDEGLLRLRDNESWKILEKLLYNRGLDVDTSSGQNQVIGRRHFGSKAKAPGGGGGVQSSNTRELFDPVIMWEPRLKLDASGEAKITIPLNDSMTSFRIVAVAMAGDSLFGHGQVTVESTKDLILYPGFAPLVREGDQVKNAFTIRNTTSEPMKVEIEISSGEIKSIPTLAPVELAANDSKTIDIPVVAPVGLKEISFKLKAKDVGSGFEDTVITKVRVEPPIQPQVLQATLFQLDKTNEVPVKQPADALPGKGGLRVAARATLVNGLAGIKSYMESYPYSCLEQQISKNIVLENKDQIVNIIESLPSYMDGFGVLKFFTTSMCGSVQLSRYIMNILHENGHVIPKATLDQLISGIKSYLAGNYSCRSWWDDIVRDPYQDQAKILLMETLSRYGAFTPDLLTAVNVTPNLWQNETATAWFNLLKRQKDIPRRDALLKQAENILRSRMNFQGSLMNLQGSSSWEADWRLFSSPDQAAYGVFGVSIDDNAWAKDVGRMARGVVARLRLGRFDTTMANAWAVTQLRRFSRKFEKDKVIGKTQVSAPGVSDSYDWGSKPDGEVKQLAWPTDSAKKPQTVAFSHAGGGKPWIHLETLSAIPLKDPFFKGYKVSRKVTPVIQQKSGEWRVGDVANVELTVTADADQSWVVVRDPLPAGASHLGTGLNGSSRLLNREPSQGPTNVDVEGWPTEFEEKSLGYFTSYAGYLPRGKYNLSYRIRLNSAGEFKMPVTRVEAMYAPETFGESPNADWKVGN